MGPQPFEHVDRQFLGGTERLHIRWKGFAANLIESLESPHHTCTTDALLVSQRDGFTFKVHRLVLASASDILKRILLDHDDNPVILIDDVDRHTLEDLTSYLYRGQVTLNPIRLAAFVSFGKAIALKGIGDLQNAATVSGGSAAGRQDPPLFTGLSLLASAAALNAGVGNGISIGMGEQRKRRFSSASFNDENDPGSGNGSQCAINLSIRSGITPTSTVSYAEEKCPKSPATAAALFPMTSLLNIPDPATFKWRRCSEHPLEIDGREGETPPPLAIDMSVAEPVDLPATPSPSPSSLNGGGSSTSYFTESSPTGMVQMTGEPAVALPNGLRYLSTSDDSTVNPLSRDADGKKWKSRQPKLCVHCDRYFSNQFNLKQVLTYLHTHSVPKSELTLKISTKGDHLIFVVRRVT